MLAARVRSGLVETVHAGAVAVVGEDGELIAHSGEIDRPFFLRSAAKPFQAWVSQRNGAGLAAVELALATASHDGQPVHAGIVTSMLEGAGLEPGLLRCPPGWPLDEDARRRLHSAGTRAPAPIWNNCSGKHAGWLRACAAQGWPLDTYLTPAHPIQSEIIEVVSELGGLRVDPVGVDGCGAPVLQTTVRVMARLYSKLATLAELGEMYQTMHRYPSLLAGTGKGESEVTIAIDAAAKRGAAGCIGAAVGHRLGIAVKCWDGSEDAANVGLVAALAALGELPAHAARVLGPVARPPVLGGGAVVGEVTPLLELSWT